MNEIEKIVTKMLHGDEKHQKWLKDELTPLLEALVKNTNDKLRLAKEALEDFRDYGTRHDIHPTGMFHDCGHFDSLSGDNWQGYIKSQDSSVRERAKILLEKILGT